MNPDDEPGHPGLEIDEDMRFQHRAWAAQRLGIGGLALVVAAALAGVFGGGPLSRESVSDAAGAFSMEHERFARFQSPARITFDFHPGAAEADGKVRVWLDRKFVESVTMDSIEPQPASVQAAEDRFIYAFAVADPARSAGAAFSFHPEKFGVLPGRTGLAKGDALVFRQFIYP